MLNHSKSWATIGYLHRNLNSGVSVLQGNWFIYIFVFLLNYHFIECAFFYRIDDIQDNSILRRGIPVAHSIYGVASTINAANYVIFLAIEKVLRLDHPDVSFMLFNPLSCHSLQLVYMTSSNIYDSLMFTKC